jgi:acetoin utilization deacetylase AcuC-like enzyme
VFPRLVAFQPDFILVSAGFDAHENDHLHLRGETMINEFDYKWLTEELQTIANHCCGGRLVSVLEGGYNTNLGPLSPLAMSVQYHVRALMNTNSSHVEEAYFQVSPTKFVGKRGHMEDYSGDDEEYEE